MALLAINRPQITKGSVVELANGDYIVLLNPVVVGQANEWTGMKFRNGASYTVTINIQNALPYIVGYWSLESKTP